MLVLIEIYLLFKDFATKHNKTLTKGDKFQLEQRLMEVDENPTKTHSVDLKLQTCSYGNNRKLDKRFPLFLNLQVDDDEQALNEEPPIPPARKKVHCRYTICEKVKVISHSNKQNNISAPKGSQVIFLFSFFFFAKVNLPKSC